MAPLEAQIGEHKAQLKRRRQSIERIHEAADDLEERMRALEQVQIDVEAHKRMLTLLENELKNAIAADIPTLKAAA
jgi:Tfp pilus assembly protein PilN